MIAQLRPRYVTPHTCRPSTSNDPTNGISRYSTSGPPVTLGALENVRLESTAEGSFTTLKSEQNPVPNVVNATEERKGEGRRGIFEGNENQRMRIGKWKEVLEVVKLSIVESYRGGEHMER